MKFIFILILLFAQGYLFANMAEPVIHGTVGARPFTSNYVDILHEELNVKLDARFETADFEVIYKVHSAKDGRQIPLLFYASEYLDDFEVHLDGNRIDNVFIPMYDSVSPDSLFVDYPYFFSENNDHSNSINFNADNRYGTEVSINDLIYFQVDLAEGEHSIKVTYTAKVWTDFSGQIKAYDFRYSLSPAKYWKSFGVLDLAIDASAFPHPIQVNVGAPLSGDLIEGGNWSFEGIPVEVLEISYHPEINSTAEFFAGLGGLNLALIIGFLCAILHVIWTSKYRRKHPEVKFSIAVIIGAFLVPLVFILVWIFSFDWLAYLIGPDASEPSGYRFMAVFGYPFLVAPYWLIVWIFDKVDKNKLAQNK